MRRLSPQKAINSFCKGCIYDQSNGGNWREQVEACTVVKCELYHLRPLTAKSSQIKRENHLASLSPGQRTIALERSIKRRENMLKMHANEQTTGDAV
jgi:hypothetical protein